MNLASFFVALAGPVARKVLSSLGLAVVTYAGVDTVVSQLVTHAQGSWGGLVGDAAVYIAMSGTNTGLSILCGAVTARVSMAVFKSLAFV